ncbi:MAG: alpha-L-fucosidase [Clostridia bacterium]
MDISDFDISQDYKKICKEDTLKDLQEKAASIVPTKLQLEWQEMELTVFLHYGMNTFSNAEWGRKGTPVSEFAAENFDPEQWIKIIKEAGFKGAIFNCKHHDGFCMWPSKYTDYSIKNAIYKNGKGDMVKEVANACKKYDVKFGIYLSPWDINEKTYGDSDAYNEYFINQLTELLTNYGDIYEVWFDGACGEGPNGKTQEYDWISIFNTIKRLQPNAVASIMGPDVRWVGNEAGKGRQAEWSAIPYGKVVTKKGEKKAYITTGGDLCGEDLGSDEVLLEQAQKDTDNILYWSPAQVDVSIRPGWFYHEMEDKKVRSLDDLLNIYYSSVGSNAQLLLNIPPDKNGRINDVDAERIEEFGRYLKRAFEKNLAKTTNTAITKEGDCYTLDIKLSEKSDINLIMLTEDITKGQKVDSFKILAKVENEYKELASCRTIGYKKILPLEKVWTDEVKIVITKSRGIPTISSFGVYNAPTLNSAVIISRDDDGYITIKASTKAAEIYYSIDNSTPKTLYTEPFLFKDSGEIFATANSKDSNLFSDKAPIVSLKVGMLKENWKVISCNSTVLGAPYKLEDMVLDNACHTMVYTGNSNPEIVFDMGKNVKAKGFIYIPITHIFDFVYNIFEYEISFSDDNEHFTVADSGRFDNIKNNPTTQEIMFKNECEGRYLKIKSIRGLDEKQVAFGKISLIK